SSVFYAHLLPPASTLVSCTGTSSAVPYALSLHDALPILACEATPTSVPAVSKKSTNRNVSTTIRNWTLNIVSKSNNPSNAAPNVGATLGTEPTIAEGIGTIPVNIPNMAVAIIPINIAAGTFLVINITVITRPAKVSSTPPLCTSPRLISVDSSPAITPDDCSPTKVMKNPIPALTAIFISIGIELITYSRKPVKVRMTKITPENRTPVSAVCHGISIVNTTVNAKNAFSPIPGASAIGYFAIILINKQPTKAAKHAGTKTALISIFIESGTPSTPCRDKIDGLTAST